MFFHTLYCCFIEVVKVLVSSGEDPDQSLSLIRLSSYLSQVGVSPDDDEEYVLESSNPPATPTIKPIKGSCVIFLYSIIFMCT